MYEGVRQLHKHDKQNLDSLLNDLDARYDSFFASILTHDSARNIVMPDEVNIISWNYDAQIEKAFMNYSKVGYDDALKQLNFLGASESEEYNPLKSGVIKLNGTAGFYKRDRTHGDLFDFSKHSVDNKSLEILSNTLSPGSSEYETSLRFAWIENEISKKAIKAASSILSQSDLVVVIGYSFPYFNRKVDRAIFQNVDVINESGYRNKSGRTKVHIQSPDDSINDVVNAFRSIKPHADVGIYTGKNQFLIPNEF